jgi:hypothetical protein
LGVPSASLNLYFISQICSAIGVANRDILGSLEFFGMDFTLPRTTAKAQQFEGSVR